ncbi:MAG TPA: AMIN domain-containing protein [Candidatus Sulfotelmatobacter sp.]|nr:AMIN domain-containing protein [Candidatus Sulfotelmatobacter sp.]
MELRFKARQYAVCCFFCLEMLVLVVLFGGGVQLVHAGQQPATVRRIAVTGDAHDLGVEITASKPVTPRTQFVTDPDRLIVDLPEAQPAGGLQKIPIHRGELRDVRVALLSANPPITRVVLDLVAPPEFRVLPLANTVLVKLANSALSTPASSSATIVSTTDQTAVVKPAATTSLVETPPLEQPSKRSWAHWTLPILVTMAVLAMLVMALIAHIQNKRFPRGI